MKHWTERSVNDFLYRITADFVAQLEDKIASKSLNKSELAQKLGISKGRVSQILNNPGNLSLRTIIKFARALGIKIAIVAYDDKDQDNKRGPIDSEIFRICWENSGRPADFWSLKESRCAVTSTATLPVILDSQIMTVLLSSQTSPGLVWNNLFGERQRAATVGSNLGQDLKVRKLECVAITEMFGPSSGGTIQ
jgi:transcriptional regulator with XRE-family HTH domain